MALSRKGYRPMKIGQRTVYWRARKGRDATSFAADGSAASAEMIIVTVVTSEAFKSGKSGQRLEFSVPRGSTVGPIAVRYVVEHTPEFTGEAGRQPATPRAAVIAQARAICVPRTA